MEIREAGNMDWNKLSEFFLRIYRPDHPLQVKEFWEWQYGNPEFGRSFIFLNEQGEVAGHVGATFGGGVAWIINVYLFSEYRGKGILRKLYDLARDYYPLGATAANEAGLGLYRNMRWIRYHNLVRYVKVNPLVSPENRLSPFDLKDFQVETMMKKDTHYFKQPGLKGVEFVDGSRAVIQDKVGGFRIVDFIDLKELEEQAWSMGFKWMDYITSWNDLKIHDLIEKQWIPDFCSEIPWRLNPVVKDYYCNISYLSEKPFPNNFVVHRSFSDHGRIGSLIGGK